MELIFAVLESVVGQEFLKTRASRSFLMGYFWVTFWPDHRRNHPD